MERFVIAGTQRTGTSLINSTLDSHPDIRCLGEVFNFRKGRGKSTEGSYRQFINERRFARSIAHHIARRQLVKEHLDQLYQSYDVKATGFKFMLSQARDFPDATRYLQENRIKVVHLVRENVLKTLVSRVSAKTRKLYHSSESVEVDKVYLPPLFLLRRLEKILDETRQWKQIALGNPYIEISYEAFLADREHVLRNLLEFIGVDYAPSIFSTLRKINPDKLSDVIKNFDEVTRLLVGTKYEIFLD